MLNKELKKKIITLSYKHKLSHIGSCLNAVDAIVDIYSKMKIRDKFVLSSGHAHLAHLVVMEANGIIKSAEETLISWGIHCDRRAGCEVTTGSLGQGITVALGLALGDLEHTVYCLCSDGESAEGSFWEALRLQKDLDLENLNIQVICNDFGGYRKINSMQLRNQLEYMSWAKPVYSKVFEFPKWINSQAGHYKVMTEKDYNEIMELFI